MGAASFVQSAFFGGEWSKTAQGMIADPKYKVGMNSCLNVIPLAQGAATRRPGTRYCAATRGGAEAALIPFDFQEQVPYNIELTNQFMRFFAGTSLAMTNDTQTVSAISTANPAVVQTAAAHGWSTGNSVMFAGLGTNNPLLQNRVFTITVIDTTHFSIAGAITGTNIDGSTLGAFVSGTVSRILEIATPYVGSDWKTVRSVQAETNAVLLQGSYAPELLTATALPSAVNFATFSLSPMSFIDGPYYDPPTNGAQMSTSGTTGIVNLTVTFPTWSSTTVYAQGACVLYSSVTYQSLVDQNLSFQPDTHGSQWAVVSPSVAIRPNGFVGTDIGRSIRLFSEPPFWYPGNSYTAGNVVAYVGSDGNTAYYTCVTTHSPSSASNAPGLSTVWGLNPAGALWTWGRITSLLNVIPGNLSGSTLIGNMNAGGGVSAAFDGVTNKSSGSCAIISANPTLGPNQSVTLNGFAGKNYSGASAQKIAFATIYPSTNKGIGEAIPGGSPTDISANISLTIKIFGKQTAPASAQDGTQIGSVTLPTVSNGTNTSVIGTSPITVVSSDQTTAWNYVWANIIVTSTNTSLNTDTLTVNSYVSQVVFFSPSSTSSAGVSVELIGGNLLYSNAIRTWRLGLYSGTTGYPKCGTYHEGRLWLSGAVGNRIDGSVPNSIVNGTVNFAPTESDGTVTDASAIAYTFDAPDVNAIFHMTPDQQGIVCGTQAGEWLVQATTLNSPLTPTSMQAHRVTKIGCANILPRRSEHTLLLVQKHQRKIVEYFADIFSGKFTAPDLSEKAKHLSKTSIEEIAYQQELAPVLWARMGDGSLKGMTYKRDTLMTSQGPTFNGWHRHTLGSGRTVESICVGPNNDGTLDTLAMVTNDAATNIRHVEIMTDIFEEGSAITSAWFLDDAVAPSSYTTAVVLGGASGIVANGLWHLNGKTVTVFAGGLDVGDWTVSNGSVSVPFAPSTLQTNALFTQAFVSAFSGAMPIVVGFTYTSQGQLLPPDTQPESGSRNGPGFGKVRRMHKFAARLVDTQGISFGTRFDTGGMHAAQLKTAGGTALLAANVLFTGVYKDTVADDAQGFASMLGWQVTRPFPATVAALGGFLQTEDE